MTPFDAYRRYLAFKQHFTVKSYDVIKYNGKVRAKESTFENRRDRYLFKKLSRQPDVDSLLIANFLEDRTYVADMVSEEGRSAFAQYTKVIQRLSYNYKTEMKDLLDNHTLDSLLKFTPDTQYPPLLGGYLSKQVSIQTLIILDRLVGFIKVWDKKLSDDLLWPDIKLKLEKYSRILQFNTQQFRKITVDICINKADDQSV